MPFPDTTSHLQAPAGLTPDGHTGRALRATATAPCTKSSLLQAYLHFRCSSVVCSIQPSESACHENCPKSIAWPLKYFTWVGLFIAWQWDQNHRVVTVCPCTTFIRAAPAHSEGHGHWIHPLQAVQPSGLLKARYYHQTSPNHKNSSNWKSSETFPRCIDV